MCGVAGCEGGGGRCSFNGGVAMVEQENNFGYLTREQSTPPRECPKYNWKQMDAFERVGVNMMDAVGARNAVCGAAFGLVVFTILMIFFREQISSMICKWKPGATNVRRKPKINH